MEPPEIIQRQRELVVTKPRIYAKLVEHTPARFSTAATFRMRQYAARAF